MQAIRAKIPNLLPVILWLTLSCSDEEKVSLPPVAVIDYSDGIDKILLNGSFSSDPERQNLVFDWSTSNENIVIEGRKLPITYFKIPHSTVETSVDITLKVSDLEYETEASVSIPVPPLTEIRSFGIGKNLTSEADNSAHYAWYLDQGNTGSHSLVNCGPASVTMAIKWANENFNNSVEDARNTYRAAGGWWFTNDIINYLNLYKVTNWTIPLADIQGLKEEINEGNIVILCLDMYYVKYTSQPDYRVNKFYVTQNSGWGHFIVIKGYKEVDGKIFFEAYDSYSLDSKYQDQTLRGMNRYYSSRDLDMATQVWWDYAIVVSKNPPSGKRKSVDVNDIIHKPGR